MKETEHQGCSDWFKDWFNTTYYHLLYSNRNKTEAQEFLTGLLKQINVPKGSRILDLGCGKGRHSLLLHQMGMDVTGIDLSKKNIEFALQYSTNNLEFYVHDMRQVFRTNYFDIVFNLFTSFGYFERDSEDIKVLKSVHADLKPNGLLVLDYLNVEKTLLSLHEGEQTTVKDKIEFKWKKSIRNNFIEKEITVTDNNCKKQYQEKVKLLKQKDFRSYLELAGFVTIKEWGNYNLQSFDPVNSDRYIVLAQKI